MPTPTLYFADLVRETSSATGTGAFALSGALPGHRRFADAVPVGVDFCYAIAGITTPAEWEVGTGQIDAQGRLSRASVSASSAAGALVPFTAGLKSVALTVGADWYAEIGDVASQSAAAVTLTGGTINATSIGAVTPATVNASLCQVTGAGYPSYKMVETTSGNSAAFFIHPTGHMAFRTETAGGLFFDTFDGTLAVRRVSTGYNSILTFDTVSLSPGGDNSRSLGTAAKRWSTAYLATSPVVTSDERDKIWHGGLNALEIAAAMEIAASIGLYQWRDAVEVKGADGARLHVGVRAQHVWRIMAKHGLVAPIKRQSRRGGRPGKTPYAFLCWDEWCDEKDRRRKGNRYGVRADQLTLFVVAGLASQMVGAA